MTKFCPNCGNPVREDMKFCNKCGTHLNSAEKGNLVQYSNEINRLKNKNIASVQKMFFSAQGRLNRKPYIIRCFIIVVLYGIASLFVEMENTLFEILAVLIGVGCIASSFMLNIRRLHDLDKSGWFVLLQFIPIVNLIMILVLACAKINKIILLS